ncbi:MAG: hypothetical protein ACI4WS_12015 [Oscillospiraceae bacterium]
MNTEKKSSHSVLRRLIPAVAMFAASSLMLSTATYAWFTMNKEVQMTGLNMSATASEGIEISLGGVDSSGALAADLSATPADTEDEKGWGSTVVVGNYYNDIGKLIPASSVDGTSFYDATNASDKGRQASTFKSITLGGETMAKLDQRATFDPAGENTANGNAGYYVDIPVHIRTSKIATTPDEQGDIYCKLIISSEDTVNKDLYKAVRVAFVPVNPSGTTKIFAIDDTYYGVGAVSSETGKSSVAVITGCVSDDDFPAGDGEVSGLQLPYAASAGTYGHLDFIVRVWLEGESTSCYDDKAGQAWNISLAFSLGEFQTT